MKLNPKYVLLVSDALLPLLGFFLWDWGLYFILLFLMMDLLASEVIVHLKSKKTTKTQNISDKAAWRKGAVIGILLLGLLLTVIHIDMIFIDPKIDFIDQLYKFWTYEEMGIQQGYFLLPFVALGAYQQYKMTFLTRGLDRTAQLSVIWKKHHKGSLIALGGAGLALGVSQIVIVPEVVYVLAIVGSMAAYSYFGKED